LILTTAVAVGLPHLILLQTKDRADAHGTSLKRAVEGLACICICSEEALQDTIFDKMQCNHNAQQLQYQYIQLMMKTEVSRQVTLIPLYNRL